MRGESEFEIRSESTGGTGDGAPGAEVMELHRRVLPSKRAPEMLPGVMTTRMEMSPPAASLAPRCHCHSTLSFRPLLRRRAMAVADGGEMEVPRTLIRVLHECST
jgi:hypothetical protein